MLKKTVLIFLAWLVSVHLCGPGFPGAHAEGPEAESFRIAQVQMDSSQGKAKNLEKIASFVHEARREHAKIVCFPELSISGYERDRPETLAEPVPGDSSEAVSRMAVANGVAILAGFVESEGENLYITHIVAFSDGRIETYRKTHPGSRERKRFSAGDDLPVFRATIGSGEEIVFAVGLCYDLHFPEIVSVYSMKGALIVFAPHASPLGGQRRIQVWDRYLGARAYDNTLYVAACNHLILSEKAGETLGSGMGIWGPDDGSLLKKSVDKNDAVLFYDLDLAASRKKRTSKSKTFYLKDRRNELYIRHLEPFVFGGPFDNVHPGPCATMHSQPQ